MRAFAGRVYVDRWCRVQVHQVLINLMLNGIDAMKDTSIELMVVSRKTEDDHLLISVSDFGVGPG